METARFFVTVTPSCGAHPSRCLFDSRDRGLKSRAGVGTADPMGKFHPPPSISPSLQSPITNIKGLANAGGARQSPTPMVRKFGRPG